MTDLAPKDYFRSWQSRLGYLAALLFCSGMTVAVCVEIVRIANGH